MKKVLGLIAGSMLLAAPAMAVEVPQVTPAPYNCDYAPSCEVAPGIYGKMSSPVMSKFNLSIGGYVKLDYAYNSVNFGTNGVISPGSGVIPAKGITAQNTAARQDQSDFSIQQSRLWFKVNGPTFLGAKTGALIEGDFYGSAAIANTLAESPVFRARLAYGTLDWANTQILFGQFWDLFAPMVASTQDFRSGQVYGAPNTPRIPMIKVTQKINFNEDNQLKLVVGAEDPGQLGNNSSATGTSGAMVDVGGQAYFITKALGVAPGYFGMSMSPFTLGVFGMYGNEKSNTNAGGTLDTWGAGVYAFVPVLKSKDGKSRTMTMSFEGQAYEAANMTFNGATAQTTTGTSAGTVGGAFGAFPAGNQNPAKAYGLAGQIIFYPTQDLGITGGYGIRHALNNASYTAVGGAANYQVLNQEIYGSVTYDLNAAVRVAAEYQNLKTVYGNSNGNLGTQITGMDNTIRFAAYYFF